MVSPASAAASSQPAASAAPPSLTGPQPRQRRKPTNRFGVNADMTTRGTRNFFPDGFVPALEAHESIGSFGVLTDAEREELRTSADGDEAKEILKAYTKDCDLYRRLLVACREASGESERQLRIYRDYLFHLQGAIEFLRPLAARVHRGIDCRVETSLYPIGAKVTWQAPSSASRAPHVPLDFVQRSGSALSGTWFVIDSKRGKDIAPFSCFPDEQEVLFWLNSHFVVECKAETREDKMAMLPGLADFDVTNLDVYHLKQV